MHPTKIKFAHSAVSSKAPLPRVACSSCGYAYQTVIVQSGTQVTGSPVVFTLIQVIEWCG
jgi:hypothetical protein